MAKDGSLAQTYVVIAHFLLVGDVTDQSITCNAALRTLNQAACENAAWHMKIGIAPGRTSNYQICRQVLECFDAGILLLIIVDITGNCAIDIRFRDLTIVPWADVKPVVVYLLDRCLGAPMAPQVGGTSSNTHLRGRKVEREIDKVWKESRIGDQQ